MRAGTKRWRGTVRRRARVLVYGAVLAAAGLGLSSCATWKPQRLNNGQPGYRVDCSGPSLTWSHCYQKAGRACPHGYTIVEKSGKSRGHVVTGDLFNLAGDDVTHRRLLIHCATADDPAAGVAGRQG